MPSAAGASTDVQASLTEKAISQAIGKELRRAREACGWSRLQLTARLPSGIGERTLLSYEHGTRHATALRVIEICHALGIDMPTLVRRALQRARIHLENLPLQVDLHALMKDRNNTYRPMIQWARNTLNEHPNGIVEVVPVAVRNLALFAGHPYHDLVNYLARFTPDYDNTDDGH